MLLTVAKVVLIFALLVIFVGAFYAIANVVMWLIKNVRERRNEKNGRG